MKHNLNQSGRKYGSSYNDVRFAPYTSGSEAFDMSVLEGDCFIYNERDIPTYKHYPASTIRFGKKELIAYVITLLMEDFSLSKAQTSANNNDKVSTRELVGVGVGIVVTLALYAIVALFVQ